MRRWISKLAALVLVGSMCLSGGCSAESLARMPGAAEPFSVKVGLTNKKDDRVQVHTAIPEFAGFDAAGDLNAKIKKISADGIAQIKKDTEGMTETPGADSLYYMSYFDYARNADVLSVWIFSENYTGGAHGMHYINAFTLNTKTGEYYTSLGSLFQDPEAGKKLISDQIIKQIQDQPDGFFPEAVQTVKDKKGDFLFYLDGQNLVVYFDLYDIVPYAGGIPKFTFPLKDLKTKVAFAEQEPAGDYRLNGETTFFKSPVYSDDDGVYLPLEETAGALNHTVLETGGSYTVDGKPVAVKKINGVAYTPLTFFTGTLGDYVIYDGTVLRMFTQVGDITAVAKLSGTSAANAASGDAVTVSAGISADGDTEDILAYVKKFDAQSGEITYDPIEWITQNDTARMKELGLNKADFPNGFYIYNPIQQTDSQKISQNVEYKIIHGNVEEKTDEDGFVKRLNEYQAPYHLTVQNKSITKIEEQYIP